MVKRAILHTLSFDGPLVKVLLEHDHGNGLQLGVGQESVENKCERHYKVEI
jgi:hypothetical protein